MVLRDMGDVWLVEIDKNYPGDLEGGYSIAVGRLACATRTGHTEILSICEKRWVDPAALEDAVKRAFPLAGVKPNYDLADEMIKARQMRSGCGYSRYDREVRA